jgi:hypothetical protein
MRCFRLIPLFLCFGCNTSDKVELGDGDADTDTDTDVDTDIDPSVAPTVTAVTADTCFTNTDSEEVWAVDLTATDPQGEDTVDGGTLTFVGGDADGVTEDVSCFNGNCSAGWEATRNGVGCSFSGTFRFVVVDENGNSSAPFDYSPS